MKTRQFQPKEVLLSLTTQCNLRCEHCDIEQKPGILNKKAALEFLAAASSSGIERVGFTGGEPFLALDLMCAISKEAAKRGMLFGRIMTNGGWFGAKEELISALKRLFRAGFDGDICISVDAFHRQDIKKCASLIKAASNIWGRRDVVSIAAVRGAKDGKTRKRLVMLARLLRGRTTIVKGRLAAIKSEDCFIKIFYIDLAGVGKAAGLKKAWNGKWFKDDMCEGPGNVLHVLPNGTVKPCCGYAADSDILTIGSIVRDSTKELIRNARKNSFIAAVFGSGLHPIRKRLEKAGVIFPGRTTDHCFFCNYLASAIPRPLLNRCL
jgi:hypothetical protein